MPSRVAIARAIGVTADIVQIGLFPLFAEGLASPLDIAVDSIVCVALTWLVGWHFVFLPSFLMKGLPLVDLAPTWTIAIMLATRKKGSPTFNGENNVPDAEPKRLHDAKAPDGLPPALKSAQDD